MSAKLIIFPLLIMAVAALMGQMVSSNPINQFGVGTNPITANQYNGNFSVNNNQTFLQNTGQQFTFGVDLTTGAIAIIITLLALGAVVGIQVLGSGLNSVSSMAIFKLTAFYTIWGLVAVLGTGTITSLPYFGWIIFFALTVAYTIGAVNSVSGGTT